MTGEGKPTSNERLDDHDLVAGFSTEEIPSETVMERFFEKIKLPRTLVNSPLKRLDGQPMTDDNGVQLTAGSYLAIAGEHGQAVQVILGFLKISETHPSYSDMQASMVRTVSQYVPDALPRAE